MGVRRNMAMKLLVSIVHSDDADGLTGARAAAVIAELAALVGAVTLELGGHLVGSADPADELFSGLLERQVDTLGLVGAG